MTGNSRFRRLLESHTRNTSVTYTKEDLKGNKKIAYKHNTTPSPNAPQNTLLSLSSPPFPSLAPRIPQFLSILLNAPKRDSHSYHPTSFFIFTLGVTNLPVSRMIKDAAKRIAWREVEMGLEVARACLSGLLRIPEGIDGKLNGDEAARGTRGADRVGVD